MGELRFPQAIWCIQKKKKKSILGYVQFTTVKKKNHQNHFRISAVKTINRGCGRWCLTGVRFTQSGRSPRSTTRVRLESQPRVSYTVVGMSIPGKGTIRAKTAGRALLGTRRRSTQPGHAEGQGRERASATESLVVLQETLQLCFAWACTEILLSGHSRKQLILVTSEKWK